MSTHAADLRTSARLQAVYNVLKDNKWHTTLELHLPDDDMSAHSSIDELRSAPNNLKIESKYDGTHNGRKRYKYMLESSADFEAPKISWGSCPRCAVSGFYSSPASRADWNKRRCSACGCVYEVKP